MVDSEFSNQFGFLKIVLDKKWGEYSVFIPEKLPPEINFDKKLVLTLTKADSTLSKLSGVGLILPNPDLLITPHLKKEALSSSRIEGTRISLDELFLSELENKDTEDSLEVKNYIKSINYALKQIENQNITLDLIKEMHKILMGGVRGKDKHPGTFRRIQNWIGSPGSTPRTASFVPPPYEDIDRLLNDMINYMNTYDEMPLLIKCALMHYQFETIHPFCDGNGRIGRALIVLYLIKKNKLSKPLLYISSFFEKYKKDYINYLSLANKKGDFYNWLLFFLEAIKDQSEHALDKALEIHKLKEKYYATIQKNNHATNILKIIDSLFHTPYISVTKAKTLLNTTYPTAKRIIQTLEKLNILILKDKKSRNKIYKAQEIIDVVQEE